MKRSRKMTKLQTDVKVTKLERIQFFYDLFGTLFSALILGAVCSFLVNPSSDPPSATTVWEQLHFYIPFVIYLSFFYLFWQKNYFKSYRLNWNWLFVSVLTTFFTLLFTFLIKDIKYQRFFTSNSVFLQVEYFIIVVGIVIFVFIGLQSCFWVLGLIHRIAIGNNNDTVLLNLNLN